MLEERKALYSSTDGVFLFFFLRPPWLQTPLVHCSVPPSKLSECWELISSSAFLVFFDLFYKHYTYTLYVRLSTWTQPSWFACISCISRHVIAGTQTSISFGAPQCLKQGISDSSMPKDHLENSLKWRFPDFTSEKLKWLQHGPEIWISERYTHIILLQVVWEILPVRYIA